jgi:hypothetical protein
MPTKQAILIEGRLRMSTTAPNLRELLHQRISKWTGSRVQNLTIDVGGGRITLRGRAKSFHIKQLAQSGAQEILPNAIVENAIVVE